MNYILLKFYKKSLNIFIFKGRRKRMSTVNQTYESQIQPQIQEIQNNENSFDKIGIAIPENVAQNIPQNSLSIVVTTPQQLSQGPSNLTYAQMSAPQNNDKGKFSNQYQ